ncbi:uncharacterized protein [Macrobrachium rosenbergii]|uniref:uncharacterized protein n=1 Tax=Macrobrachium rosenbergii TaxID=79674 RepID=UPI0034D5EAB5
MHSQPTLDDQRKPEVILYYNKTTGGFDAFDHMCATYSCSRKTQRWPLHLLWAAQLYRHQCLIHSANIQSSDQHPLRRQTFLSELAMALICPWAKHRLSHPTFSWNLRYLISDTFNMPQMAQPTSAVQGPESDTSLLYNSRLNAEKRCKECRDGSKKSRYIFAGAASSACAPATCTLTASPVYRRVHPALCAARLPRRKTVIGTSDAWEQSDICALAVHCPKCHMAQSNQQGIRPRGPGESLWISKLNM